MINRYSVYPEVPNKYLCILTDRGVVQKYEGRPIPDVCRLCSDDFIYIYYRKYKYCVIDEDVLNGFHTWEQVRMLTGGKNIQMAFLKKVVRSLFPKYAYKLDGNGDIGDYSVFDWEFYIPTVSKSGKNNVIRKTKSSDGQVVVVRMWAIQYGDKLGMPCAMIDAPKKAIILRSTYQTNGGKPGIMRLTIAVPPLKSKD